MPAISFGCDFGEGMGCAVVSDGEVRRGFTGIAGEVAHLVTAGPRGRAMLLTEVFRQLGLRRPGTTAIDVPALLVAVADPGARAAEVRAALGTALCGVLAALVALADPEVVILGGEWGAYPAGPVRRAQPGPRRLAHGHCRLGPHVLTPIHSGITRIG